MFHLTWLTHVHTLHCYTAQGVPVHVSPRLRRMWQHVLGLLACWPVGLTCKVMSKTFIGGNLAKGAWPWAISRIVMPQDQMSADESYLDAVHRVGGGSRNSEELHPGKESTEERARRAAWQSRCTARLPVAHEWAFTDRYCSRSCLRRQAFVPLPCRAGSPGAWAFL